nr:hypothetical protein [Saprospiraceae bacterium]
GVTAKALARWRAFGHENQLFETLERWREEMHIQEMINHISKTLSQEEEQAEEEELRAPIPAEAIVRATVALTLAYASTYDHPNQLSNGLIETFLKLLEDKNKYVRERYSKVTVPMVVSIHFWQLRESLPRLLNYSDLVYSVAIGIAQAYDRFPDKVEKLIDEWLDYVRQYPQYRSSGKKITHRDSVLITVILALAEIRYSSENAFNAKSAYEIIVELQKEEYHKAIEKYYFHFVLKQLDVHASEIDSTILDIIENLSHKRRPKLIQAFTRIYLNQRSRQKGGSITWRHNGHEFPVWLDGGRPPTEIERTMVKWLLEDNPSGQQIAIDTLYHFGEALDSEEIVFVEEYQDKNLQNREPERETPHIEPKEPVITFLEGNWISQIIGWFTLSNYAENIRPILWNILPVLALKQYTSEQNLSAVADKLRRYGASEGQEVAGFISRFAHYFNQFLIWRVVAIVALVILVVLILVALSG